MPNGKGEIDCRYCVYAWPANDNWQVIFGSDINCLYHQQKIPKPSTGHEHRFCSNVHANELWFSEQGGMHIYWNFLVQAARFGAELEPGMLYEYSEQSAKGLKPLKRLRVPDFDNRKWKMVKGESPPDV